MSVVYWIHSDVLMQAQSISLNGGKVLALLTLSGSLVQWCSLGKLSLLTIEEALAQLEQARLSTIQPVPKSAPHTISPRKTGPSSATASMPDKIRPTSPDVTAAATSVPVAPPIPRGTAGIHTGTTPI